MRHTPNVHRVSLWVSLFDTNLSGERLHLGVEYHFTNPKTTTELQSLDRYQTNRHRLIVPVPTFPTRTNILLSPILFVNLTTRVLIFNLRLTIISQYKIWSKILHPLVG